MSRVDFGPKPLSLPQPVWIIATYDENGNPDAMNAAWGGISESDEISVCLSPGHKTCRNFEKTGAFTVSMADAAHITGCDFVGIVSCNDDPDKFKKAGFTEEKSRFVNAPVIKELPVCMECRVKDYNSTTCVLRGEIVNVNVDESVMTGGKVDIEKAGIVCFDPFNHSYHIIGEMVASAFKEGKKLI